MENRRDDERALSGGSFDQSFFFTETKRSYCSCFSTSTFHFIFMRIENDLIFELKMRISTIKGLLLASEGWKYIQMGNRLVKDMEQMVAFKMARDTWAEWVDKNVDPAKTTVFFLGVSPSHYKPFLNMF